MIVADNPNAHAQEFENLLSISKDRLDNDAQQRPGYYQTREGTKFEKDVCEAMEVGARGGVFEDSIKLVSGRRFPDIVANNIFGVEVKTSRQGSPWKCVGNSVLETSRIENVERIYMFFGKIISPPEFKFRRYEDCLYEVAVTHSPRYMVDMNTPNGETIFDKIGTSYDELRGEEKPIHRIMDYYRGIIGDDSDLWWLDTGDEDTRVSNIVIRFWNNLHNEERESLRYQILALFPEVIRKGHGGDNKYNRAAAWLTTQKGIVCPSFRDMFTGGSRDTIIVGGVTYNNISTIFCNRIQGSLHLILNSVDKLSSEEISRYWGVDPLTINRREEWLRRFITLSDSWLVDTDLNIRDLIRDELGQEYDHLL